MSDFCIKIAGYRMDVTGASEWFDRVVHDFKVQPEWECDDSPVFPIVLTQEDFEYEMQLEKELREKMGEPYVKPSKASAEQFALLRQVARTLVRHDVLLIHGSCIVVDGRAYLFIAESGVGKSTHSRFWREVLADEGYGDRVVMLNDDKPFARVEFGVASGAEGADGANGANGANGADGSDGSDTGTSAATRVVMCGSPWQGKHNLGSNMEAPLAGIAIISRAGDPEDEELYALLDGPELERCGLDAEQGGAGIARIHSMTAANAFPKVLLQGYRNAKDTEAMAMCLRLAAGIAESCPMYHLYTTLDPECARMAYRVMSA